MWDRAFPQRPTPNKVDNFIFLMLPPWALQLAVMLSPGAGPGGHAEQGLSRHETGKGLESPLCGRTGTNGHGPFLGCAKICWSSGRGVRTRYKF